MRRARPGSLIPLLALIAVAAHPARPAREDAARREMERAEQVRAAEQAAQQQAAARAAAAAAEARHLAEGRIAAVAHLRQAEAATAEVAARIDELTAEQRKAQAALAARAETMQPLLPVIERLSLFPAETLLAVPAPAEQTLRGVLVLHGLSEEVGQEALALRRDQDRLAAATRALQAEVPRLAAAQARQKAESDALDQQIAAAQAGQRQAEGQAAAAAEREAAQAARAETLRGMLADLEAQHLAERGRAEEKASRSERGGGREDAARRQQPVASEQPAFGSMASAAQPRAQLTAPVEGSIVRGWGDPTDAGPAIGVSYRAPPAARVVSPCAGRVAFAAPFRSYGLLLIVNCGGGYHAVLAGFERLDARVGQSVATGEPVGVMPGWQPGQTASRPTLYVELRHDGQPVNPAPWLKASS
ncbi:MAG TPA: peptidoglycan DD-metalloendopeptidase family protein [Acetobacteraceae bacterium]|nr:peptidoglycan DD-metalloendopeptidase family protein [Acetobacteraceae bacterium]